MMNHRSEAKLQKTRKRALLDFHSELRLSKFLSFGQFLGHFSTSGVSKKFSMGDMMMSKVFKRLPEMRAFQRTPNRDHTINIFEYMSIDRGGYPKYPPPASYNPVKHWFAPTCCFLVVLFLVFPQNNDFLRVLWINVFKSLSTTAKHHFLFAHFFSQKLIKKRN